jgi:hypothetical protein
MLPRNARCLSITTRASTYVAWSVQSVFGLFFSFIKNEQVLFGQMSN